MGAERDPAGTAGPGVTSTGTNPGREGTRSGSTPMGDPAGTAEVHTGLHRGRASEESYSGLAFAEGGPAAGAGVRERVRERARDVADSVREGAGTIGHRAGEVASQARERVSAMSERTNRALEQRGLLTRLQENPLPALGVAFGIGFLLAGGGRGGPVDSPAARARRELRSALMAGLTAGAAQAARGFLQTAGRPNGPIDSLAGNLAGRSRSGGAQPESGRATARGRMSGGLAGSRGSGERPPSHQENL